MYDCIVIGGGPAGISAAIYIARYNRSVLVFDKLDGRWNSNEINENYFGFPYSISVRDLIKRGRQQAENFGARFVIEEIIDIAKENNNFILTSSNKTYESKTVIFANGVKDKYLEFENNIDCLGKSLFWCLTCDGHKAIDKSVVVVGNDEEALMTSCQFLNFTNKVSLITNYSKDEYTFDKVFLDKLANKNIKVYFSKISNVKNENGYIKYFELENAEKVEADYVFNNNEPVPNSDLAKKLGVKTDAHGYIITDNEQRTNIPFVYAAGDITKNFAHQVVTAAHEGSAAAEAVNWDLYEPEQRGELTF